MTSNVGEASGNSFEGIPLKELLSFHLSVVSNEQNDQDSLLNEAIEVLWECRDMLWDYFGIQIKDHSEMGPLLTAVPCLIENFVPQVESYPKFVYTLAQVDFNDVIFQLLLLNM